MQKSKLEFEAIGTHWQVDFELTPSSPAAEKLTELIKTRVQEFDRTYSRFRSDSLVARISRNAGVYALPEDARRLLLMYRRAYKATNGMFTPLIGQTLVEAGYDAEYSLKPKNLNAVPSWEDALEYNEATNTLTVKIPVLLDFGAAGKGYIVDIIGELLEAHNVTNYTVDAGGDIRHRSSPNAAQPNLRVGLENPQDLTQVLAVANIKNASICGSSGNRRTWANFHHILNPKTLQSAKNVLAVWTVAKTTLEADAMSTCLFFTHPDELKDFDFEYAILNPDFSMQISNNFPYDEIFTDSAPSNR